MPARYGALGGALADFFLLLRAVNQDAGAQKSMPSNRSFHKGWTTRDTAKTVQCPCLYCTEFCPARGLFHRLAEVKSRSKIRISCPSVAHRRCVGFLSLGKLGYCLSHVSN
jgi:hypothetical protein